MEIEAVERDLDELTIAYHEAGHVAIALFLKVKMEYVTIIPNDEEGSGGHVNFEIPSGNYFIKKDGSPGKRLRMLLYNKALISLAGGIAQSKYEGYEKLNGNGKHYSSEWANDYSEAIEIANVLGVKGSELIKRVITILETEIGMWNFIKKITELLLKKKTLSYSECKHWYDQLVFN